ncbi:DUF1513 domain-containing protein [Rhodoferax saidenbachensis]|uniref:Twin-arginine translocation pathway signal n=1 Tax=Rhodoferax saidenbachensis TaxID=1484693 RepID=A0ABU1ZJH3_9BURK|nr:DUF1513 domain-containing protein [Rhodoferax saidenbachensis]MDR7305020.1 hypothetical protein [Rhodoferax saidenbachensis]
MVTETLRHPTRRSLLAQAALLSLGASAWESQAARPPPLAQPQVLTAWNVGGQSWAGVWTPGAQPSGIALPARAHQLLLVPGSRGQAQQALVLARRPGEYLMRMDVRRGRALQWHTMEDDRYLGGHAALSASGKTFFTTETDGETGQGLIAERDLQSLEKLREFPSGGIGPHALLLEPAGTLLVANGGILNLPETGRRKLNVGRMEPNLTRLDAATGAVLAQYRLTDSFLSLRHLAIAPNGTVAVALQAEHADPVARTRAPAMALLEGEQLRTVPWDAATGAPPAWDGYAGDVCCTADRFWISAPHAGWLASWTHQGHDLQSQALPGAGALAANGGRWMVGGDEAALLYRDSAPQPRRYGVHMPWDNHAALLHFS